MDFGKIGKGTSGYYCVCSYGHARLEQLATKEGMRWEQEREEQEAAKLGLQRLASEEGVAVVDN